LEQFVKLSGIAAPILHVNIDTDQIIPARFLVRASDAGLEDGLFAGWRFTPDGNPNPDFILNRAPWTDAKILLADRNFGCGSSREAAPKALRAWGFQAIIAPSFGGIFFNNCFRNGILPVELPIESIRAIAMVSQESQDRALVTIDLDAEEVGVSGQTFGFRAPRLLREMLLRGVDEIELTLSRSSEIESFRAADRKKRPWSYSPGLR
jgi:3-isopropylmalate/(R)-2-methylmalate dehydratase small subunit